MPVDFHEVSFPRDIALGSQGGPVRKTEIVTLASGHEHRNSRWAHSRRRYDAGLGIRSVDALHAVLTFFEERRGRLYGFRFHDRADCKSCPPSGVPSPTDATLGTGDGATTRFQLSKAYGTSFAPFHRPIRKPVAGSVRVALNGAEVPFGPAVSVDAATGLLTFASPPAAGALVTAGFVFDVPVRFDTDELTVDLSGFAAGAIPSVPLIEILT